MSSTVHLYEKLGAFYLGRALALGGDPGKAAESDGSSAPPLLYDSKDLTTHAVCLGMTGSGKTGLGITLLEEAAIDGVPSIVIDPKGDMANLLLTFPRLDGSDFRPWVDPGQAARAGQDTEAFAEAQAALWKNGLAKWEQSGERIARLREAADFEVFTPGSETGRPISILGSFRAPGPELLEDPDLFQDRISTTAISLLALLGIDADPIRSREAILLSNLLEQAWRQGDDLDLASLIQRIQDPPFEKVGILSLESFYPAKERFELAMALNNLLASPTFQGWMAGDPLDVDQLLHSPSGKPRVSILSIAHLSDAERMFFVSLLLGQVLGWMRTRPGTSALRAIVYMDEIFGYLPPTANPPSKKPLLTLLKQARAFGLGLVLATQNPVDLDYKALSNIGTWLIGRLQTERDQARVMDGLLSAGAGLERSRIEKLLAGLDKRVFLLHNVHEDAPVLFRVRWVLSYLRGPLTRREIKRLTESADGAGDAAPDRVEAAPKPVAVREESAKTELASASSSRPVLPSEIRQRFVLPSRAEGAGGRGELLYRPRILGAAHVSFVDSRKGLEAEEEVVFLARVGPGGEVDWREAELSPLVEDDLAHGPEDDASFADPPPSAAEPKTYRTWEKNFADMLYRERRWPLWKCPSLKLFSEPGESERDFRIRVREKAHEERDREVEILRERYERKLRTADERIRRAEQKLEKEQQQASSQKADAWIRAGTTLLGALLGRKTLSRTNLNKASSAFRGFGRSAKEAQDVEAAEDTLEARLEHKGELELELREEIEELHDRFAGTAEEIETFELKPRRADVDVRLVALAWLPYRKVDGGDAAPSW